MPGTSASASSRSCRRSRPAAPSPSAATSRAVRTAATAASRTTAAATGTVQSARELLHANDWKRARPTCCRSATSTSCSRCRPRSPTPPPRTRPWSTSCCSERPSRQPCQPPRTSCRTTATCRTEHGARVVRSPAAVSLLRRPHDRHRDLHALHPAPGAKWTAAISREDAVVGRHGTIHLQIVLLSGMPRLASPIDLSA